MAIEFIQKVSPGGSETKPRIRQSASLAWAERQRSRLAIMLDDKTPAVILLARGEMLHHGDLLTTADGRYELLIQAAPESVLKITAHSTHALLRLVYHLANRHVSAMIAPDAIFIEPDPILAEMVRRLGGAVSVVTTAFTPEHGAYHGQSDHQHSHHSHGELADEDLAFGRIGEALSRRAHGQQ